MDEFERGKRWENGGEAKPCKLAKLAN